MKKSYFILKILIILAALIAVGYLATTPDSEVILKRPWLEKSEWFDALKRPWLKKPDNLAAGETIINIPSNTQGQYGDLRIGVGNIKSGEYEIDGVKETGVTAMLWVSIRDKSEENKTVTVYIGQSFEIDKYKITVHDIQGELVTLRIWDVSK